MIFLNIWGLEKQIDRLKKAKGEELKKPRYKVKWYKIKKMEHKINKLKYEIKEIREVRSRRRK